MRKRWLLTLCFPVTAACSAPATPTPITPFSAADRDGNSASAAKLVRELCVNNVTDDARFAAALRKTGWPLRRTQEADPNVASELDVWRLPGATLIRGRLVAGQAWTCSVALDEAVAPAERALIPALNGIADGKSPASRVEGWRWRPSRFHQAHMTLGSGSYEGRRQTAIFVEVYELPLLQAILGA